MLGLNNQRNTLSYLYDMDQIQNSVNARLLPGSIALYSSSTMLNEKGPLHRRLDAVKNNALS